MRHGAASLTAHEAHDLESAGSAQGDKSRGTQMGMSTFEGSRRMLGPGQPSIKFSSTAKPWKTPYERALHRVRSPQKVKNVHGRSANQKTRRPHTSSSSDDEFSNRRPLSVSTIDILPKKTVVSNGVKHSSETSDRFLQATSKDLKVESTATKPHEQVSTPTKSNVGDRAKHANDSGQRPPKPTLKELEIESKGTQFEGLVKAYVALAHQARQKEHESAAKIEELIQAMFQKEAALGMLEQDNRKLRMASEKASFQMTQAQEQVSVLMEQVRLNSSLQGNGGHREEISSVLGQANHLLHALHQVQSPFEEFPWQPHAVSRDSFPILHQQKNGPFRSHSEQPVEIIDTPSEPLCKPHFLPERSDPRDSCVKEGCNCSWTSRSDDHEATERTLMEVHSPLSKIRRERERALVQIACNRSDSHLEENVRMSPLPDGAQRSLQCRVVGDMRQEGEAWQITVQIFRARDLPHTANAWVSCSLSVMSSSPDCRSHAQFLRPASNLFNQDVKRTRECASSSGPSWNERFELFSSQPCPACGYTSHLPDVAAELDTEKQSETVQLDGSRVTLAIDVSEHAENGETTLLGSVILPAQPGLESSDWYMLLSNHGCPVINKDGHLALLKIRVAYERKGLPSTLANDWTPVVPIHSSLSVITLIEPSAASCGISIILDDMDEGGTQVLSEVAFEEKIAEDVALALEVPLERIEFCGVLRSNITIFCLNINPGSDPAQPTPRELALALCNMVSDPLSAIRYHETSHTLILEGILRLCGYLKQDGVKLIRTVLHAPFKGSIIQHGSGKGLVTESKGSVSLAKTDSSIHSTIGQELQMVGEFEDMFPITPDTLFLPSLSAQDCEQQPENLDILPFTVCCLFSSPECVPRENSNDVSSSLERVREEISKRKVAGVGLALMDFQGPDALPLVYVHGIIPGGSAFRDGTIEVGDVILAVDGSETAGMHQHLVRSAVIGDVGTSVRLSLQRTLDNGEPFQYEVELQRDHLPERVLRTLLDSPLRSTIKNGPFVTSQSATVLLENDDSASDVHFDPCPVTPSKNPPLPPSRRLAIPRNVSTSPTMSIIPVEAIDGRRSTSSSLHLPVLTDGNLPDRTSSHGFLDTVAACPEFLETRIGLEHPSPIKKAEETPTHQTSDPGIRRTSSIASSKEFYGKAVVYNKSVIEFAETRLYCPEIVSPVAPECSGSSSSLSLPTGSIDRSAPDAEQSAGKWRVNANILRAKGLVRLQGGGLPSLFCRIAVVPTMDAQEKRNFGSHTQLEILKNLQHAPATKIVHQNTDPVWKEQFTFYQCSRLLSDDEASGIEFGGPVEVIVVIFDRDDNSDIFRGILLVPVEPGLSNEGWYTIQGKDGSPMFGPSGSPSQVLLSISYTFQSVEANFDGTLSSPNESHLVSGNDRLGSMCLSPSVPISPRARGRDLMKTRAIRVADVERALS